MLVCSELLFSVMYDFGEEVHVIYKRENNYVSH